MCVFRYLLSKLLFDDVPTRRRREVRKLGLTPLDTLHNGRKTGFERIEKISDCMCG